MTTTVFTLDGSEGVDLSTSNSGASLLAGQAAGYNTAKFRAADGVNNTGATFTMVSGGSTTGSLGRWPFAAANATGATSVVFRTPESLTLTTTLFEYRISTGRVWLVKWDSAGPGGRLLLVGAASEYNFLLGGSDSVGLAVNTKYRLEAWYVNNNSAAGGSATYHSRLYDMSDTLLYSYDATPSGTGAAFTLFTAGNFGPSAPSSVGIDNLQLNDGGTAAIGKYVPPTSSIPPTASSTETDNVSVINAAAVSSPGNGGTLAFSIAPTAGVTTLAPGIWEVAPQSAAVTYTYTVTETYGAGLTATSTGTAVVGAAQQALGIKVLVSGAWT